LSLNSSTGAITGTPTTAGPFNLSCTVTDSAGATSPPKTLVITVVAGPVISNTSLPSGVVGAPYSGQLTAGGGSGTYVSWSGSGLPPGLSLNTTTGAITGKPTTAGLYNPSFTVTDSAGVTSPPATLPINIVTSSGPIITNTSLPGGEVGAPYSGQLTASGGSGTYVSWSGSGLPPGLILNTTTGAITGTPTTAGPYNPSFTVTDSAGATSPPKTLLITVIAGPVISNTTLPSSVVGAPYFAQLTASGGSGTYVSWGGSGLPPGLILNTTTGAITGTPTTAGPYNPSFTVTDSAGATSPPKTLSITITTSSSTFTTLYTFTGGSDGGKPFATPILNNGSIIGTTYSGGTNDEGTVYSVNIANKTESALHSFMGQPSDGAGPIAGVVLSSGNLYGATSEGGGLNDGAAYELTLAGQLTLLHSFAGPPSEGFDPTGTPVFDLSGNLYGTTYYGSAPDVSGTVYEITAGGVFSTIASFSTNDGPPRAGLYYAGGQLYGTTVGSGSPNFGGTVYQVGVAAPLYTFTGGADGAQPLGEVIGDGQGNLYGTASGGGTGSFGNGNGVIFKVNIATGAETVVHTFAGTDGAVPVAGLAQDSLGNWYGTTLVGGASNYGTVFELDTSGNFTTLYSFTGGADGASPNAGVVVDTNGNIYGVTSAGGSAAAPGGYGTVFVISPAGGGVRIRKPAIK
jgi:uncharacterized repeat protein (TIGR03803 family)